MSEVKYIKGVSCPQRNPKSSNSLKNLIPNQIKGYRKGCKNPLGSRFLGKHHSEVTKIKLHLLRIGKSNLWMVKEKHPNWQGGISKLPYSFKFNQELKEKIRKRDNYQCQNKECNITEEEHLIVYGQVLLIHHIDYDKQNCEDSNLVTLCKQCNSRVNFNKSYWMDYFNKKIEVNCG
jgi:5-methylcytosine-specific restriction endonuclease McrA